MSVRIHPLYQRKGVLSFTLSSHKDFVVNAFFGKESNTVYVACRDAALYCWKYEQKIQNQNPNQAEQQQQQQQQQQQEQQIANQSEQHKKSQSQPAQMLVGGDWKIVKKHLFHQHSKLVCCSFVAKTGMLAAGFASGVFGLYEMPDFSMVHSLSISQSKITTVSINNTGEWLAFGSKLGQLLVWEWQSETCMQWRCCCYYHGVRFFVLEDLTFFVWLFFFFFCYKN